MLDLTNNITRSLLKEYSKRSFYNFFRLAWSYVETSEFIDNWHIKYICDILQDRQLIWEKGNKIEDNELFDVLINICPSASKSLIVSVMFPAWLLLRNPKLKILNATYSFQISEQLASKRLRLIQSDLYQSICNYKLKSSAINNMMTDKGGSIFATSISGSLTGTHYDVLIIDDPNSPQSIYSEPTRNEANRFITEVLPSRKTNVKRSYTIYLQQRFHNDDVSGTLLAQKNCNKLKHIVIPAIDVNNKSFFEARFPLSYFDSIKEQLGSVQFNAQYMQVTQPEQGGIIKKDWIKFIDGNNAEKLTYFLDSAYGGDKADDNAIIGCYKHQNNLVIQMVEANKMEFPELLKWLKLNLPNNAKLYIEGKASGKTIIQTLKRETNFNIIEIQPKGSKNERKNSCSPYFESGRVFINNYVNHKTKLVEQLIFDNPRHDDLADVTLYAIEYMLKKSSGSYNIGFV